MNRVQVWPAQFSFLSLGEFRAMVAGANMRTSVFNTSPHALANLFIQFIARLYLSQPCHIIQKIPMDEMEHIANLPTRHSKPVHPLVSDMLKGSIKSQISQLVPAVSNIVIK